MSTKEVKTFSEAMQKDQKLNAKFVDLLEKAHEESIKFLGEKIISFAGNAGFKFSNADLQEFIEIEENNQGELSDETLKAVAGGRLWGKGYGQTLSKEYRERMRKTPTTNT
ncbi:MAG: hypothetical protein A2017_01305 [Lentisphaerae bacterium GWF2_44_16]|nr:MAG: hypothetical protein A2017_01305 [Lentisphaerae bacterium GWF2_44_16]